MPKHTIKLLVLFLIVVFVAGCTGSVGVSARSYIDEKNRVDQNMQEGNFGYVGGKPIPEDRSEYKKTRKIYVLEITKDVEDPEEVEEVSGTTTNKSRTNLPPRKAPQAPDWQKPIVIPELDSGRQRSRQPGTRGYVDYEVQENDTLQKISKKFYDTYRRWPENFEENKVVLKDPNKLKPGIVIRIPVEE